MTPQEMLDAATKDFESTFKFGARMGFPGAYFYHVADGKRHDYIVVTGNGVVKEGELYPVYDTAEEAVSALRNAWREFEGKNYLYWRIRPEIDQDTDEMIYIYDPKGEPNPNFGKWKTYSRFRVLD